jgi:hypothetical protein
MLSLGPVLDLIERWQQAEGSLECMLAEETLLAVDLNAVRQLAEQHAAQLRKLRWNMAPMYEQGVLDAADFLSPRREPEAE